MLCLHSPFHSTGTQPASLSSSPGGIRGLQWECGQQKDLRRFETSRPAVIGGGAEGRMRPAQFHLYPLLPLLRCLYIPLSIVQALQGHLQLAEWILPDESDFFVWIQ